MTIKELVSYGSLKLKKANIKTHQLDAVVLTCFVFRQTKEWLYLNDQKTVPLKLIRRYKQIIANRSKHKPIAYITGIKEFYNIDIKVNKNVLIPRPETEGLIDLVLEYLDKNIQKKKVAEIGTGSGCISIALAKLTPNKISKIYATDTSGPALIVAAENAKRYKVLSKINFIKTDVLKGTTSFDIIVSNPPYIIKDYNLSREVLYEPKNALFFDKDFLQRFIKEINEKLKKNGIAFIEIAPEIKKPLEKEIKEIGLKYNFKKDLWGKIRYIILKKKA